MILVGNKSDLEPERTVSHFQNIKSFISHYQVPVEGREGAGLYSLNEQSS